VNWLKTNKDKINTGLMILVFITLILSNNINSMSLILLGGFNFIFLDKESFNILKKDKLVRLFLLWFIVYSISYFLSENKEYAIKVILRNASLIILPGVLFLYVFKSNKFRLTKILKMWIFILAALLSFAFIIAIYKNLNFNLEEQKPLLKLKSWYFTYHYLAGNINMSAIYLSLYVAFALLILTLDLVRMIDLRLKPYINKALLLLFLIFLLLLSARTILFITFTMLFVILLSYSIKKGKIKMFFFANMIFMFLLTVLLSFNDVLRLRLFNAFKFHEESKYFSGGISSRFYQWKSILNESLGSNIFIGAGIGDVQPMYLKAYESYGLDWAIKHNFNAHNMYIELISSIGVVGLIVFLSVVYISFRKAILNKDSIYTIFLILFVFSGLTESMLNRHHGIIFFILFGSLCYFSIKYNKE